MNRSIIPIVRRGTISQFPLVGSFTLTTAIDTETDQATSDIDSGILIDVSILTTAIDSRSDTITISLSNISRICGCRIFDIDLALTDIGAEGLSITFKGLTLACTEHITSAIIPAGTNASATDVHLSLTTNKTFRVTCDICELVWPTETEAIDLF